MNSSDFPQRIHVLGRPLGMSAEQCNSLPVYSDGQMCISRWQPTAEERAALAAGADVWVSILSGRTQPPIAVSAESPFGGTPAGALALGSLQEIAQTIKARLAFACVGSAPVEVIHQVLATYLPLYVDAFRIAELSAAVQTAHDAFMAHVGPSPMERLVDPKFSRQAGALLDARNQAIDTLRQATLAFEAARRRASSTEGSLM